MRCSLFNNLGRMGCNLFVCCMLKNLAAGIRRRHVSPGVEYTARRGADIQITDGGSFIRVLDLTVAKTGCAYWAVT
jgi:hypothetical protein